MAILYNTEESLRERAAKCIEDDFKHQAIETAQETFYQKRQALVTRNPIGRACARRRHVSAIMSPRTSITT